MRVWSAHAGGDPKASARSAEHGVAADRCARAIVRFLTAFPSALAAAEHQAVRRPGRVIGTPCFDLTGMICAS